MSTSRLRRFGLRVATFAGGQGGVQVLNALTGLLLIRLLPKPEFAIYAIAYGIQATVSVLTDIGFGGAIMGLVGHRYQDKVLLGHYIRAANHVRRLLLLIVTAIAIICLICMRNLVIPGHSRSDIFVLAFAILVSTQFQAWASYYEIPLLLNHRLVSYYGPQLAAALLRISAVGVLFSLKLLSANSLIFANTLSIAIMGFSYRFQTRSLIVLPEKRSKQYERELIRFLSPMLPSTLNYALQAQVSVFLMTIFGKVSQVADVAAAGRISQVFLLLNASNAVLVAPYFAKSKPSDFGRRYVRTMLAVLGIALVIGIAAWAYPAPYLLLLGSKYANLQTQVQLVVYAAAITYVSNVMWTISVARKWVFWWSGTTQVVVMISIQIVCIVFIPMSTSVGVLEMGVFTSIGSVLVQLLHMAKGLYLHRRDQHVSHASA